MKTRLLTALSCLLVFATSPLFAQLATPNAAGVSLGTVNYTVRDPEAHRKIWVDALGAKPVKVGATELLKMPGVFVVLTKGEPATGSGFVDHVGFWGKRESLDAIRAKLTTMGIQTAAGAQFVNMPDGFRLEFVDDPMGPDGIAAHHGDAGNLGQLDSRDRDRLLRRTAIERELDSGDFGHAGYARRLRHQCAPMHRPSERPAA